MASPHVGGDALCLYHTNGRLQVRSTEDADQPHPSLSTGVRGSLTRVEFLYPRMQNGGIPGLRIDWISSTCGEGSATIVAGDGDYLTFVAPGESSGTAAYVPDGATVRLNCTTVKYAIVTRRAEAVESLVGQALMRLAYCWNNALAGANASIVETSAAQASGAVTSNWVREPGRFSCNLADPTGTWDGAYLTMTSGACAGEVVPIEWGSRTTGGWTKLQLTIELSTAPQVGDTFTVSLLAGRLHCLMLHNRGTNTITNLRVWVPRLGSAKTLSVGYPTTGLDELYASAGGSIGVPSAGDWEESVRFLRILRANAEIETVGGRLDADGDQFIVPHYGRHIGRDLGAVCRMAAGDVIEPVCGLTIGFDSAGSQPYPTVIQPGTIIEPADPEAPAATHASETVLFGVDGAPILPTTLSGWTRGTTNGEGLYLASLPAGHRVGLWLFLPIFPGMKETPLAKLPLEWSYAIGANSWTHSAMGLWRIAADHSADRFRAYRSLGVGTPISRGEPVSSGASLPLSIPLVDDALNNVSVYKANDYGIEGLCGESSIRLQGGSESDAPPSAPFEVRARQSGVGAVFVQAFYAAMSDASPADLWEITAVAADGSGDTAAEYAVAGDIAELAAEIASEEWLAGASIIVGVSVKRSADSAVSDTVFVTVELSATELEAPTPSLVLNERKQVQP